MPPLAAGLAIRDALLRARTAFSEAGIDNPALDARLLAADALGTDAAGLLIRDDRPLGPEEARRLESHLRRRLAREPVGRILGTREFWGLPFRLSPATLEPRPDTEAIVEAALRLAPDRSAPLRMLDLGTGTGCILVALASELPGAFGVGIDRSAEAAATAAGNAARNGVGGRTAFLCGDWAGALAGRFDLVLSNPPYIARAVIPGLAPEVVRHDPALALDGGEDGLDAYRAILADLPRLLTPNGTAILEIGFDQAAAVASLAPRAGLAISEFGRDLAGRDRFIALKLPLATESPTPI